MEPISIKQIVDALGATLLCGDENIIIKSITTDSRKSGENMLFIPLVGENFDGHDFIKASFDNGAVASLTHKKEITPCEKALIYVDDTKEALCNLARSYLERNRTNVVALTGSVGKTTTKDMVAAALSEKYNVLKTQGNFNNDIGLPLTVFNIDKSHDIAVLEMGMNHFGEIHKLVSIAHPDKAIITNVGMSHIENLGSREGILSAKMEIVDYFDEGNMLFLNGDDDMLSKAKHKKGYKITTFGIENEDVDFRAVNIAKSPRHIEFDILYDEKSVHIELAVPGRHNVYNALCAFAIAKSFDIEDEKITKGLAGFCPSGMRMNIESAGEITLINDCYNASPSSVEAALDVLCALKSKRHIAILGDMLEMGDYAQKAHTQLGEKIAGMNVDMLLCVGNEAKNMCIGAKSMGMDAKKVYHFKDNKELTLCLKKLIEKGDAVLVKASRSMRFEQIAQALKEIFC